MPYFYLGQWRRSTAIGRPHWEAPRKDICVARLDLRSLPQIVNLANPLGYGLFALSQPDNSVGYYLGDNLAALVTAARKAVLKTALGLGEDIVSSTPLDILLELFSHHTDPTGQLRWKPLRGSLQGGVSLVLGGAKVWSRALDSVTRANTIAVFQADYRDNKQAGVLLDILRKWTGATMWKLWGQMSDELAAQLLPSEYAGDGWLPPRTTITDNFNRADADALGTSSEGWSWTELQGDIDIVSNTARTGGTAMGFGRADSDLASDDHYAQADILLSGTGGTNVGRTVVRKDSTTTITMYQGGLLWTYDDVTLDSVVGGVETGIASVDNVGLLANTVYTAKTQADGSTISIAITGGGTWSTSVTNTAITNNLRTGIRGRNEQSGQHVRWDNFEAADVGAPPATILRHMMAYHGG